MKVCNNETPIEGSKIKEIKIHSFKTLLQRSIRIAYATKKSNLDWLSLKTVWINSICFRLLEKSDNTGN